MPSGSPLTRRKLLTALTGAGALPNTLPSQERQQKALLVVAHPDDEYAFAATAYRFVRELGGVAGQVVITNGEGGYRYSALAESTVSHSRRKTRGAPVFRGPLDSTLVVWGTEFGRTPFSQNGKGRDHNPWGFPSCWRAAQERASRLALQIQSACAPWKT
jgi:hypothetical protein